METKKRIAIGTSDFKKLIEDNRYFIDKSLFMEEIINDIAEIILLPRPRRFGKTLNLSMLRYFFENRDTDNRKRLFNGLKIEKSDVFKNHFGKYPVIFLTFKDIECNSFDDFLESMRYLLSDLYSYYEDNLKDNLKNREKEKFNKILNYEASKRLLEDSLKNLCEYLNRAYNQRVIILIDEYDKPIHSAFKYGYYDDAIIFIRNLLSGVLKDNEYLYKGVLTGILRVSRESIFSGFNNIRVYSILGSEYNDKFGFTEEEVLELLEYYGIKERFKDIEEWYNGYIFGGNVIYNPWSVLNFISSKDKRFIPYWANTSSNDLIREMIKKSDIDFRDNIKELLDGGFIISELDENIVFPELYKDVKYIYSLLFFGGYLKYVDIIKGRKPKYKLKIPNLEVLNIYEDMIMSWVMDSFGGRNNLDRMLNALLSGNIEDFEDEFSRVVIETLSYHDVGKNTESIYQAFLLGILLNLYDYEIISNRESGYGRVDVIILHKEDKNKLAIIMELKAVDKKRGETAKKALDSAIKQIEDKKYEAEVKKRGYKNIKKLALVMDKKRVWVKEN